MTLSDIEKIPRDYLLPAEVSEVLDMKQNSLNVQAHENPDALGFPVIVTGSRVRVPKEGFLYFMKYGKVAVGPPAAWMDKLKSEFLKGGEQDAY